MNQGKNRNEKQKNTLNENLKIYTFSASPSPQEPYLHEVWHSTIIEDFNSGINACFTMNSQGKADFYVLLFPEEIFEDFSDAPEHFEFNISQKDYVEIQFFYDDGLLYAFKFNLTNPMHRHVLNWLVRERKVNMYYIKYYDDEYVCTGLKIFQLPGSFIYDLERFLTGKRFLLLPTFCESSLSDSKLTKQRLLNKAWGFYLDYTEIVKRIGNIDDAEEIISRHVLDAVSCLQRSRDNKLKEDFLIIWIGRRIGVNKNDQPLEYYCVYLSGDKVSAGDDDSAKKTMLKALGELAELCQIVWASPLAEEGIPIAAVQNKTVYRFELTNDFYYSSDLLFKEYYLPYQNYTSYYNKIVNYHNQSMCKNNVYSLVKKRKAKGTISESELTVEDVMNLVRWSDEEELPTIFQHIEKLHGNMLDEAIYILSERYKLRLEPFLIRLLDTTSEELRSVAMIGLGLINSMRGIPLLINKLQGSMGEAKVAFDALLILGDLVIPDITPLLNNKNANIRLRAVKTLGFIGSTQALTVLQEMVPDASVRVEKAKQKFLSQ